MATRKQRDECHRARDEFFKCVDTHQRDGDEAVMKHCSELKDLFEKSCPSSWVHHFVIQRQVSQSSPAQTGPLDRPS